MSKFLAIMVLVLLCLCSCNATTQSQYSSSPSPTRGAASKSDSAGEQVAQTENSELIDWGLPSNSLKQFDDHDGSINHYKDYIINVQYTVGEIKSEPLELTWDIGLGSQFLTGLQKLIPQEEHPVFPTAVPKVILSVTDNKIEYKYIAYEDGKLYTVQNGKTYYLGKSGIEFSTLQGCFVTTALNRVTPAQAGTAQLTPFDPFNDSVKFNKSVSGKIPAKTNYSPEWYDVAIELPNYAERSTPIIIKEKIAEKALLDIINQCIDVTELERTLGGGQIIRVFDDTKCFDYMVKGEILFDYSNGVLLKIPVNPVGDIYSAIAYELILLS